MKKTKIEIPYGQLAHEMRKAGIRRLRLREFEIELFDDRETREAHLVEADLLAEQEPHNVIDGIRDATTEGEEIKTETCRCGHQYYDHTDGGCLMGCDHRHCFTPEEMTKALRSEM